MNEKPIWWDYVIYYPDEDEEGFDGVHYGGIKGIQDNAPDEVKEAFEKYLQQEKKNAEHGIKD